MRPERLHRAGIAVYALATLREAAIPLLAVFVVGGLGGGFDERALLRGVAFAVAGTVFAAVAGYVRWRTTTWWAGDDGSIHHRSGVISRKSTDVPWSRVQSIDLEQGPVQRLFGVQALHVQTGGGGARGEIVLEAVGPEVVRALRQRLAAQEAADSPATTGIEGGGAGGRSRAAATTGIEGGGAGDPSGAAATTGIEGGGAGGPSGAAATGIEGGRPSVSFGPRAERRLERSQLVVAALTAGQFGVLLPVLAAIGQLGESLFDPERGQEAVGLLPDSTAGWVAAVVVLALAAWLLSVAGTVVAFAGFTVGREGDRLRIRRGLISHREATVPIVRVRAVEVVEGVLRRPLRLASLRLEVIGHAAEPAAAQTLFPLLGRAEVRPFLDELLPELADEPDGLYPPPGRALRRYVIPPALGGLVVGAGIWGATGSPLGLLAAVPAAAYGVARHRAAGWRLRDGRLAVRRLLFARTTVLAPAANRESHAVAQTLLQRRGDLADLEVDFGKSTTARIRHLEAADARQAFDRLSAPRRARRTATS